jgi:hypothetical protein
MECPRCESLNHRRTQGTGPHAAKLTCADCGAFIKWLSANQLEALGGFTHQQLDILGE